MQMMPLPPPPPPPPPLLVRIVAPRGGGGQLSEERNVIHLECVRSLQGAQLPHACEGGGRHGTAPSLTHSTRKRMQLISLGESS